MVIDWGLLALLCYVQLLAYVDLQHDSDLTSYGFVDLMHIVILNHPTFGVVMSLQPPRFSWLRLFAFSPKDKGVLYSILECSYLMVYAFFVTVFHFFSYG